MPEAPKDSILNKTKALLGVELDDDSFDIEIITLINSVFADLVLLGIGPDEGYMIEDSTTPWSDYLENKLYLNQVKSYMYLRVRMLFDPPATSFALDSTKEQINKYEFMLSLYAPKAVYGPTVVVPPVVVPTPPVVIPSEEDDLEFGTTIPDANTEGVFYLRKVTN
jgi:hypothetical protein